MTLSASWPAGAFALTPNRLIHDPEGHRLQIDSYMQTTA